MKKNEAKLMGAAKIAPAVGLLLFGEQALAQIDEDAPPPVASVPEPSTLALLAAGAVAAGAVHAIKKRQNRRKK